MRMIMRILGRKLFRPQTKKGKARILGTSELQGVATTGFVFFFYGERVPALAFAFLIPIHVLDKATNYLSTFLAKIKKSWQCKCMLLANFIHTCHHHYSCSATGFTCMVWACLLSLSSSWFCCELVWESMSRNASSSATSVWNGPMASFCQCYIEALRSGIAGFLHWENCRPKGEFAFETDHSL